MFSVFRMEDAVDAFTMIFAGGGAWLPCWLLVYTLSVSVCFYSGNIRGYYIYYQLWWRIL